MPRTTRHPTAWRTPVVVLLAALALCAVAASAHADVSRKKAIWGPVRVDGVSQFPLYRSLGAGIYMTRLNWNDVAPRRPVKALDPADPAYAWPAELDDAVQQARSHGIRMAVMV